MTSLIKILLIFFIPTCLNAQYLESPFKKTEGARFVISPIFDPFKITIINHFNEDNIKVSKKLNGNFSGGLKLERYSPISFLDYGVESFYSWRNFSLLNPNEFKISESSISITPFISLKMNATVESKRQYFINIGLDNRFFVKKSMTFNENNSIQTLTDTPQRGYRIYSFFEVGIKNNIFYNSNWNYNPKSGLSNFSIRITAPLFNQSSIFEYKEPILSPFEEFNKNRTLPFEIAFSYSQLFDLRKNTQTGKHNLYSDIHKTKAYTENNESKPKHLLASTEKWKYLRPIFNTLFSDTKNFGTIHLNSIYHTNLDSILIISENGEEIYNRRSSLSYELGYSYHILSNINNFNKNRHSISDFFIGTGLSRYTFFIENNQFAKIETFNLYVKVGGRFGFEFFKYKHGVYLSAGYKRIFNLKQTLSKETDKSKVNSVGNLRNDILFLGIGYKNSIYFHLNYQKIETLKSDDRKVFWDNVSFTVGLGI